MTRLRAKWTGYSAPAKAVFVPRLLNLQGQIHANSNGTSLKPKGICRSGKKKKKAMLLSYEQLIAQRQIRQGCSSFRGPRGDQRVRISLAWNCRLLFWRGNRKWLAPHGQRVLANPSNVNSSHGDFIGSRLLSMAVAVVVGEVGIGGQHVSLFCFCFFSFTISLQPVILMSQVHRLARPQLVRKVPKC